MEADYDTTLVDRIVMKIVVTSSDNDSGVVYVWALQLDNTHAPPFFSFACLLNRYQNHLQRYYQTLVLRQSFGMTVLYI